MANNVNLTDPSKSPPITRMCAADVVRRFNACNAVTSAASAASAAAECTLLRSVALEVVNQYPLAPTTGQTLEVVTLAAMHDMGVVRAVVSAMARRVSEPVALGPEPVLALALSVRLATNAARVDTSYNPAPTPSNRRKLLTALSGGLAQAVDGAGISGMGSSMLAGGALSAGTAAASSPIVSGYVEDSAAMAMDTGVGVLADGIESKADDASVDEPGPPSTQAAAAAAATAAAERDARRRDIVLTAVKCTTVALKAVMDALEGVHMRSDARSGMLFALTRLLDVLVDVVPSESERRPAPTKSSLKAGSAGSAEPGPSPSATATTTTATTTATGEGVDATWRRDVLRRLDDVLKGSADADDLYAQHMLLYARQAVLHVALDRDGAVTDLLHAVTCFVDGGLQLVSAAASWDVAGVLSALGSLHSATKDFQSSQPAAWYDAVRVFRELPFHKLSAAVETGGSATAEQSHPPHVTFFVVELLDAMARRPPTTTSSSPSPSSPAPTNIPNGNTAPATAPGGAGAAATGGGTDLEDTDTQEAAIQLMAQVYSGATALSADDNALRAHILRRLLRLCSLPEPALQQAAKQALRLAFSYVRPPPSWQRCLPCVRPPTTPLAVALQQQTGIFSLQVVDTIMPSPKFYSTFDVGVAPLHGNDVPPPSASSSSSSNGTGRSSAVLTAYRVVAPEEAAVEDMKQAAERALASSDLQSDLSLYVPPLCDSSDGGEAQDLGASVSGWLDSPPSSHRVCLLHGNSGAGKSLYCVLLEHELWSAYRRGGNCLTPLRVSLPECATPETSAVETALAEKSGLTVRAASSSGRRWVVILDGYDEVQGGSNFVTGNKLPQLLPTAKVIVTCRTEFLEAKGSYRGLFTDGTTNAGGGTGLLEVFVRAFGPDQVTQYFTRFVQKRDAGGDGGGGGGGERRWTSAQYVDFIRGTTGLQELARTPFVLRVMADALPNLNPGAAGRVTQADVYEAFLRAWWEKEQARLRGAPLPGLPADFDAPRSYANFGKDLAVEMLSKSHMAAETTAGVYVAGGVGASSWARFFARDPVTVASLQGTPLRRSGRVYVFVHKSVAEYLGAAAVWDNVVAVVEALPERRADVKAAANRLGSGGPLGLTRGGAGDGDGAGAGAGAGGDSGATTTNTTITTNNNNNHEDDDDDDDDDDSESHGRGLSAALSPGSALTRIVAKLQPAVLSFLVDMFGSLPDASSSRSTGAGMTFDRVKSALLAVVSHSRHNPQISVASATAASILVQSGVQLPRVNWRNVRVPNAVLSDGFFAGADFTGADLRGARLERAYLGDADLTGTRLKAVHTGGLPVFQHQHRVSGVKWGPDCRTVLSCGADSHALVWDVAGASVMCSLAHGDGVDAVTHVEVTTMQGGYGRAVIVTGASDGVVRVWDAVTYKLLLSAAVPGTGPVTCLSVSHSGTWVAAGRQSGGVHLLDVATCAVVGRVSKPFYHHRPGKSVVFADSADMLAVFYEPGGEEEEEEEEEEKEDGSGTDDDDSDDENGVDDDDDEGGGSSDNGSSDDGSSDNGSSEESQGDSDEDDSVPPPPLCIEVVRCGGAAESPSLDVPFSLASPQINKGFFPCFALSGSGRLLAHSSTDYGVHVHSVDNNALLWRFPAVRAPKTVLRFSHNEMFLASGSMGYIVTVHDVEAGTLLFKVEANLDVLHCLDFSPDDSLVACSAVGQGRDGSVKILDATSGRVVSTLSGHTSGVPMVAFDDDGARLASCSADKSVRVWDTGNASSTVVPVPALTGHTFFVQWAQWCNGDAAVATTSLDGSVRLWDVATGRCSATVLFAAQAGTHSPSYTVAMSSDTTLVAARQTQSGYVRVWDTRSSRVVSTLPWPPVPATDGGDGDADDDDGSDGDGDNGSSLHTDIDSEATHPQEGWKDMTCMTFLPSGSHVVIAIRDCVYVVQVDPPEIVADLRITPDPRYGDAHDVSVPVQSVTSVPPDGSQILVHAHAGGVVFWNWATSQQTFVKLEGHVAAGVTPTGALWALTAAAQVVVDRSGTTTYPIPDVGAVDFAGRTRSQLQFSGDRCVCVETKSKSRAHQPLRVWVLEPDQPPRCVFEDASEAAMERSVLAINTDGSAFVTGSEESYQARVYAAADDGTYRLVRLLAGYDSRRLTFQGTIATHCRGLAVPTKLLMQQGGAVMSSNQQLQEGSQRAVSAVAAAPVVAPPPIPRNPDVVGSTVDVSTTLSSILAAVNQLQTQLGAP